MPFKFKVDIRSNRRRTGLYQWLINPSFQTRFIAFSFLLGILSCLIYYVINLYFFREYEARGQAVGLPSDHIYFQVLHDQKHILNWSFFVTAAAVISVTMVYGLYMSHQIAGPIYRFKKYLKDWKSDEDSQPLKFRDGDYFKDLADDFNYFMEKSKRK